VIARFITPDIVVASNLDRALETCEHDVIEAHSDTGGQALSLRAWLTEALGDADQAEHLAARCRRIEVEPGDIIARQGEQADAMHLILEGRVGILVDVGNGRSIRVRSLGRHTTIGEMGLIAKRPRSATIQAEIASVLYELPAEEYEKISRDNPALGQALLSFVIGVMAERLSFASRAIGVLQR
jgi:sulfate permease, SulP family